jgi:hypothetical protein
MGLWISRLLNLFGDQEARILVLGLDNAGKTTILCASSLSVFSSARRCARAKTARAPRDPSLRSPLLTRPPFPLRFSSSPTQHPATDRLQVGEVVSTIPSE